jgi:hypothetical protein
MFDQTYTPAAVHALGARHLDVTSDGSENDESPVWTGPSAVGDGAVTAVVGERGRETGR